MDFMEMKMMKKVLKKLQWTNLINNLITEQSNKYNWEFVFLGANQDAFSSGQSFGFAGNKSMTYDKGGIDNVMKNLSAQTSSLRDGTLMSGYSFSVADRASAVTK